MNRELGGFSPPSPPCLHPCFSTAVIIRMSMLSTQPQALKLAVLLPCGTTNKTGDAYKDKEDHIIRAWKVKLT